MKILITQVKDANDFLVEDAVEIARAYRMEGYRTEIISDAEYEKRGLADNNQQDLTRIKDWSDIR